MIHAYHCGSLGIRQGLSQCFCVQMCMMVAKSADSLELGAITSSLPLLLLHDLRAIAIPSRPTSILTNKIGITCLRQGLR